MPIGTYAIDGQTLTASGQSALDLWHAVLARDPSLHGNLLPTALAQGLDAADALNQLLLTAIEQTGAAPLGVFSVDDVLAINAWLRDTVPDTWLALWGDAEQGSSGFQGLRGRGAGYQFRGQSLVDQVLSGVYRLGLPMVDGWLLAPSATTGTAKETAAALASVHAEQLAQWLTGLFGLSMRDRTQAGLDRMAAWILSDRGLPNRLSDVEIQTGAQAMQTLMALVHGLIQRGHLAADGVISTEDVLWINQILRTETPSNRIWRDLRGYADDVNVTGWEAVRWQWGDNALFGRNLVDGVGDSLMSLGYTVVDGVFVADNDWESASLADMAQWLDYLVIDRSTTGTALDWVVDWIHADEGLSRYTPARLINEGLQATNALNLLMLQGIRALGLADIIDLNGQHLSITRGNQASVLFADDPLYASVHDRWLDRFDLAALTAWIRSDSGRLQQFLSLRGPDQVADDSTENRGFQGLRYHGEFGQVLGRPLINTFADGLYHIGYQIRDGVYINSEGRGWYPLDEVAAWLNSLLFATVLVDGSDDADRLTGTDGHDQILARNGSDIVNAGAGDDRLVGGWGTDVLLGGEGNDVLDGGGENDKLDGGEGSDTYIVFGNRAAGWGGFSGWDSYRDTGSTGVDRIQVRGDAVEVGVLQMPVGNGIDLIDLRLATGTTTFVGDWTPNVIDLRGADIVGGSLVIRTDWDDDLVYGSASSEQIYGEASNDILDAGGGNDLVDGGSGDDRVAGGEGDDLIVGGHGYDQLDGGEGSDTYQVRGSQAEGWGSFEGHDAYADTGSTGVDTLLAIGHNVDIGLTKLDASLGLERLDASQATGLVRLVGTDQPNTIDLRVVSLLGLVQIDTGWGGDAVYGSAHDDRINVDGDDDFVDAGAGQDQISGGWGHDQLLGGDGDDQITGQFGDDVLDGGAGHDVYLVSGNQAGGWSSFEGYDRYIDQGRDAAIDTLRTVGAQVDIGVVDFVETGLEVIDASGSSGVVRLVSTHQANTIDLRGIQVLGRLQIVTEWGQDRVFGSQAAEWIQSGGDGDWVDAGGGDDKVDGFWGADTLLGGAGDDTLIGGEGDDLLDGGLGRDTYIVDGNRAGGWADFDGADTYRDSGGGAGDTIRAIGNNVDFGVSNFGLDSGIELIDLSAATGLTTMVAGNANNLIDLRWTQVNRALAIETGWGADTVYGSAGIDIVDGGGDADVMFGGAGDDVLSGGIGDDKLDGGHGGDVYRYTGYVEGGWSSFQGYDLITDTGSFGTDRIVALGADVDVGLKAMAPGAGIEFIDSLGASGTVRLLGDGSNNALNFSAMTLIGSNLVIDGNDGNDQITGSVQANVLVGGRGDDRLNGWQGGDTYRVTGNLAGGWSSFQGYDLYADSGLSGTDRIVASGVDVDIGVQNFVSTGIEQIDLSAVTGQARMVATWRDNQIDLRGVTVVTRGQPLIIDTDWGSDQVWGSAVADELRGMGGDDTLYGGAGNDRLDGGSGNDVLRGGAGDDLYLVARGNHLDKIDETAGTSLTDQGGTDTVQFGADIRAQQLWLWREADDLRLGVIGTWDSVTLVGWYRPQGAGIEAVRSGDGRLLQAAQVQTLVAAMANWAAPSYGQTTLSDAQLADLAPMIAAAWVAS